MNSKTLLTTAGALALAVSQLAAQTTPRDTFQLAIVPNRLSDFVSVLDTTTHSEVARVVVGTGASLGAATPDGRYAFVSLPGLLVQIDLQSLRVSARKSFELDPEELEVSPDGRYLVVGFRQGGRVSFLNPQTLDTIRSVGCAGCPDAFISAPVPAIPTVTFDSGSRYVYAAIWDHVATFDLATLDVINRSPAPAAGTVLHANLKAYPGLPAFVVGMSGVRGLTVYSTLARGAMTVPWRISGRDFALLTFGAEYFVAAGEGLIGPEPDRLELLHLNTGSTVGIPSSELGLHPMFNTRTAELWTVDRTVLGFRPGPTRYDVFDLATLTRKATVVGRQSGGGIPAFTQDQRFFYDALATGNVLVIDAQRHEVVTEIPVGDSPQLVVMQGDTTTRRT